MTDQSSPDEDKPKKIPALSAQEASYARGPAPDDAAVKEAELINSGASISDIKKKAEQKESDRAERFRDNFETISIVAMWCLFLVFLALSSIWAAHLVLPEKWQYLSKEQMDKLQLIITGGFITGIATSHIKKRLS